MKANDIIRSAQLDSMNLAGSARQARIWSINNYVQQGDFDKAEFEIAHHASRGLDEVWVTMVRNVAHKNPIQVPLSSLCANASGFVECIDNRIGVAVEALGSVSIKCRYENWRHSWDEMVAAAIQSSRKLNERGRYIQAHAPSRLREVYEIGMAARAPYANKCYFDEERVQELLCDLDN